MKDSKKITLQDLKKEVRQVRVNEKKVLKDENVVPKKSIIRNRSKSVGKRKDKEHGGTASSPPLNSDEEINRMIQDVHM